MTVCGIFQSNANQYTHVNFKISLNVSILNPFQFYSDDSFSDFAVIGAVGAQPVAVSGMGQTMKVQSALFDMLSAQAKIDHPLCEVGQVVMHLQNLSSAGFFAKLKRLKTKIDTLAAMFASLGSDNTYCRLGYLPNLQIISVF